MPIAGVVANRVMPELWPGRDALPEADELAAALSTAGRPDGGDLAGRLARALAEHQLLARADAREVERLFQRTSTLRVAIPLLERDVHDLAGLAALAERL